MAKDREDTAQPVVAGAAGITTRERPLSTCADEARALAEMQAQAERFLRGCDE